MRYHEIELVHNNEYKIYHMCHKMEWNRSISIKHYTQIIFKENKIMDIGPDSTHGSLALKAYQQNLYLEYYY